MLVLMLLVPGCFRSPDPTQKFLDHSDQAMYVSLLDSIESAVLLYQPDPDFNRKAFQATVAELRPGMRRVRQADRAEKMLARVLAAAGPPGTFKLDLPTPLRQFPPPSQLGPMPSAQPVPMPQITGPILDLRGVNDGTMRDVAAYVSGNLLAPINPGQLSGSLASTGVAVVLIDGATRGPAEVLAAGGGVPVVGTRSAGMLIAPQAVQLPDGRFLICHRADFRTLRQGAPRHIAGVGVLPDLEVLDQPETPADEVVFAAQELLRARGPTSRPTTTRSSTTAPAEDAAAPAAKPGGR